MITHPEVPTRARADAAREAVRLEIATRERGVTSAQPTEPTSRQGYPAFLSSKAYTESLLHRSTSKTSLAAAQQVDQPSHPQSSSEEQIMQRAITHQGLERVLQMYALVSLIVRRVGGALAITQKAR